MKYFVGRFFRRLVVYQIIFFWAILKFNNLQKYSNELKDKINSSFIYLKVQSDIIDYILQNPEPLTKYLTIAEVVFAVLAVFGLTLGAYLSAAISFFSILIYFNPLLPENTISFYEIKIELLFSIGVIIVILIDCFSEVKKKLKNDYDLEEMEEIDEIRDKVRKKKKLE